MVTASPRAVGKLREQLLNKFYEVGIGFRILVAVDKAGAATFSIKVDKQRKGDEVIDWDDIKLFIDPSSANRIRDYQLDYKDGPNDGFFLDMLQERKGG